MTAQPLIELLNAQPGERVLDIGCGIGETTARLAATGAAAIGLDVSAVLLEQARFKYPAIKFLCADFLAYEPDQPFDAVFAHASLHWMHPQEQVAAQLVRCVRRGGRIVASFGGPPDKPLNMVNYYWPRAGLRIDSVRIVSDLSLVSATRLS